MKRVFKRIEIPGNVTQHLMVFIGALMIALLATLGTAIFSFYAASESGLAANRAEAAAKAQLAETKQVKSQTAEIERLLHTSDAQTAYLQQLVQDSLRNQQQSRTGSIAVARVITDMDKTLNAICAADRCGAPPIIPNLQAFNTPMTVSPGSTTTTTVPTLPKK